MNSSLVLLVAVGGVAIWALTRPAPAAAAPAGTPNPYPYYNPYAASQAPQNLNNYVPSKAQDAAAIIGAIGGVAQAAASIYQTSQQSSYSGSYSD